MAISEAEWPAILGSLEQSGMCSTMLKLSGGIYQGSLTTPPLDRSPGSWTGLEGDKDDLLLPREDHISLGTHQGLPLGKESQERQSEGCWVALKGARLPMPG